MIVNLTAAARIVPLTALLLSACVSQSAYDKQTAELQQARAQATAEQSQITKIQQEQKWVVAGDMLFPEGGYQLSANGKQPAAQPMFPNCRACMTPKSSSTAIPTISRSGLRYSERA